MKSWEDKRLTLPRDCLTNAIDQFAGGSQDEPQRVLRGGLAVAAGVCEFASRLCGQLSMVCVSTVCPSFAFNVTVPNQWSSTLVNDAALKAISTSMGIPPNV